MSNPMNPDTGTLSLNRGTDNSRAEALESQLIDFPLASERLRKYDKKRFEKNAIGARGKPRRPHTRYRPRRAH